MMNEETYENFLDEISFLFSPEPDEDGMLPYEIPNKILVEKYGLDFSYMHKLEREGFSTHKYTLYCPSDDDRVHLLTKNQDVPERLFNISLRLFADSIIEYREKHDGQGELRYYPPIVLTFWAGFETFIRYSSELLIATAKDLPIEIEYFLSEKEKTVNQKGEIITKTKYHGVLDRYAVFLKYAYSFEVKKGDAYWQNLRKAKDLRDYYTHLDLSEPRELTAQEVLSFMEAILLAIITPSSILQRTLMLGVYWLYEIWLTLKKYCAEYSERPLQLNWPSDGEYLFHCNFDNIDDERFLSMQQRFDKRM